MGVRVKGARENNLKSVDVDFNPGLTVVTGVSGSGKTSLVFDTLYHEARRRFEEVFQFGSLAERLSPAHVDSITGLGPAVAVGQNLLNRNPNSTLATASGLHPFLRLLYARFGSRTCPVCGEPFSLLTEDEIISQITHINSDTSVSLLAPLLRDAFGSHRSLLNFLEKEFGANRVIVDDQQYLREKLKPKERHSITLRLANLDQGSPKNVIREKVEEISSLGVTNLIVETHKERFSFSTARVCSICGTWFQELQPKDFHNPSDATVSGVAWKGQTMAELLSMDIDSAYKFFVESTLNYRAERLYDEITKRLVSLKCVGLGYISLDRPSPTLSRGESQRVRIAVSLTSGLEDVLHILDEPTIGQHPHDVSSLVSAFRMLKGPVIYVEHDRVAAALADYAVDLGPGAGAQGGEVVFKGTPSQLWEADTATGRYFSLKERVKKVKNRPVPKEFIRVKGAQVHNLKNIDIKIPVKRFTVVTGVSGSGKSTLVEDILVESLRKGKPIGCREIECNLKPVLVDQSPIGRNSRSTPATYTKLSDVIRELYASKTGLSASYFSFNRPDGACPTCRGKGALEVKMRYLPSTWITCSDCEGLRYNDRVLDTKIDIGGKMLNIADFYDLSIEEAHRIVRKTRMAKTSRGRALRLLKALEDIGLGYLSLGQPSPTLSGGEAQRVKLAKYLGKGYLDDRLIVLDEPSTGLHPRDINGLLKVLTNLVDRGATVLIVEHNTDIIRAADWVIDLGPGAGPKGGEVLYNGPMEELTGCLNSHTAQALRKEDDIKPTPTKKRCDYTHKAINVKGAKVNNLKNVDVAFPKSKITVVTGVSGSGKSSLVTDTLEAEARRRYLETLNMYERQGVKEGPESAVEEVTGLGVTVTITPERKLYSRRNTVGAATEIEFHLAALLATIGKRICSKCGSFMERREVWVCPRCGESAPIASSNRFDPNTYRAACPTCNGVGSIQQPNPSKLIVNPNKPLCEGAMYSPGFFPKGYLCQPGNNGYYIVQAFADRYGFSTTTTPWIEVPENVRNKFYFGDPEPLKVSFHGRTGRTYSRTIKFRGFYGWIRDWDIGGTYTDTVVCSTCNGARLRPEYLAVKLGGYDIHELSTMSLSQLKNVIDELETPNNHITASNLTTLKRRLEFLNNVGLGYLNLARIAATLSAGEAQRVKLAGLLGSELTNLTVLLDEPSRGLHPSEVNVLTSALTELRDKGNTVIIVEHDLGIIEKADHIIDMGPGPGVRGGEIVFEGTTEEIKASSSLTGKWLARNLIVGKHRRREPVKWMTIKGARENNLKGETVRIPLGVLVGVCGVSGSGKSTLIIDTLGRVLDPIKHTTSVAREPLEPGAHDAITNKPKKARIIDQTRKGIQNPAKYLGVEKKLIKLYADSPDAHALGLDEKKISKRCNVCRGSGVIRLDMGFLPDIIEKCETCNGTGYTLEAWDVRLRDYTLPEVNLLTISEVYEIFKDERSIADTLKAAIDVGLGYLVLSQPGTSLSGGEAQRLRIAAELAKKKDKDTLYILDEPTLGQHMEDIGRLIIVLERLVDEGNSVIIVEHHPSLLAFCDWLIELGPTGGEKGGYVIASCSPENIRGTPTAPYIKKQLENVV